MEEYSRICLNPNNNFNCQESMTYSNRSNYLAANRQNSICRSCTTSESGKGRIPWNKGKKWKMKPGYKNQGETHPRFGCKVSNETKKKQRDARLGKKFTSHTEETKTKMRLATLKYIETRHGQVMPNYNPDSISIIEQYGKEYEYNFQHAENGGELCISGYFPDGVDQEKMTIIEIDEKHHFNIDGTYKEKDISRQKYLESFGYNFIRIRI